MALMVWGNTRSRGFPAATRKTILQRDPLCRCGATSTEADHIIPVHLGGTDHPDNGRGICHACHQTKTQAEAAAARARKPTRNRTREPHAGLR